MSDDGRETAARQFLAGARQRRPSERTSAELARETAELRRLLGQVLDVLAIVKARADLDSYSTIGQALREAIRYQREHRAGDDWPGQIGMYRHTARQLGLDMSDVLAEPVTPARMPDGRQLEDSDLTVIRQALAAALGAVNKRLDNCPVTTAGGECAACRDDGQRQEAYRDLATRLGGAR